MTATRVRFNSARKHLEVFEETWKADHDAAMECRDFEEFLAEAVMVFGLLEDVTRLRREYVFRGIDEPSAKLDAAEKDLYERWLAMVESEELESLEKTFGMVEGANRFRKCVAEAQAFLTNWAPAVAAMAVGSREHDLTEDDADELGSLVEQKAKVGRPNWGPMPVPPSDPSVLR